MLVCSFVAVFAGKLAAIKSDVELDFAFAAHMGFERGNISGRKPFWGVNFKNYIWRKKSVRLHVWSGLCGESGSN